MEADGQFFSFSSDFWLLTPVFCLFHHFTRDAFLVSVLPPALARTRYTPEA